MIGVAYVGLSFGALSNPSEFLRDVMFAFTALILLIAVLRAIVGRKEKRAYWLGFLVFGWAYLLPYLVFTQENRSRFYEKCPSWKASLFLHERLIRHGNPLDKMPRASHVSRVDTYLKWMGKLDLFQESGHFAATLIFGMLGGVISARIKREDKDQGVKGEIANV